MEEQSGAEGAQPIPRPSNPPPAPSVCHIPLPLHILRRAETASHAETNVKINHYDLSCSALTCSPSVKFPFHSQQPGSLFFKYNTHSASHTGQAPLPSPPSHSLYAKMSRTPPPTVLSPAQHITAEGLYGAAYGVRAREHLMLMPHLDNEVYSWRDLSSERLLL